jgi:hypothetical protein
MAVSSDHVPLHVIADMSQSVAGPGDPLHLDGILAHAAYRDLPPAEREQIPDIREPWALDFDLPLARWEWEIALPPGADGRLCVPGTVRVDGERGVQLGRVWGWRASAERAQWLAMGIRETVKRMPVREMVRYSSDRRVEISGPMKSRRIGHATRFAHRIEWWALGDEAEVRRLLDAHVTHVGKLHHHGSGRVLRWLVERCDEDLSVERPDGTLARVLPSGYGGRPTTWADWGGIRPPYHHPSRRIWIERPAWAS